MEIDQLAHRSGVSPGTFTVDHQWDHLLFIDPSGRECQWRDSSPEPADEQARRTRRAGRRYPPSPGPVSDDDATRSLIRDAAVVGAMRG